MDRIGTKSPIRWYLREWRKKKGLTLDQVATRLDTNRGQISKLERGDLRMNDDWIWGFADALGIEPADLLRDPEVPTQTDLLKNATPTQRAQAEKVIEALLKAS